MAVRMPTRTHLHTNTHTRRETAVVCLSFIVFFRLKDFLCAFNRCLTCLCLPFIFFIRWDRAGFSCNVHLQWFTSHTASRARAHTQWCFCLREVGVWRRSGATETTVWTKTMIDHSTGDELKHRTEKTEKRGKTAMYSQCDDILQQPLQFSHSQCQSNEEEKKWERNTGKKMIIITFDFWRVHQIEQSEKKTQSKTVNEKWKGTLNEAHKWMASIRSCAAWNNEKFATRGIAHTNCFYVSAILFFVVFFLLFLRTIWSGSTQSLPSADRDGARSKQQT